MIYFDNSATTLVKPPQVAKAVLEALNTFGNCGRGAHNPTLMASRTVYSARESVAKLFNIDNPLNIAFCSNATTALNMAIQGTLKKTDHIITTVCEHNSVLRPLYALGAELTVVGTDKCGNIDYDEMSKSVKADTRAVVIGHGSNVTGNVVDIKKVYDIIKGKNILLIVDVAQTAGAIPVDVMTMGIDILCFTGHKALFGPQGTGGIYVRDGIDIAPLYRGGSGFDSFNKSQPNKMPELLEAGTLNAHCIAGLKAGVDYILNRGIEDILAQERMLFNQFIDGISTINNIKIYGDVNAPLRTAAVSVNIGDADSALVSDILWEDYEICTRSGAHCAPLMHNALGTEKQGAVRFSFSPFNTSKEIDIAIKALKEIAYEIE